MFFSILSSIYYPSTIPRELYLLSSHFFLAVMLIPTISINARRLHDINKSALYLILFAPYFIILRVFWFQILVGGDSGRITDPEYLSIASILTIIFIATYGYWLTKKGDKSSNKYGPNPIKK